jgi:hypothetical protein
MIRSNPIGGGRRYGTGFVAVGSQAGIDGVGDGRPTRIATGAAGDSSVDDEAEPESGVGLDEAERATRTAVAGDRRSSSERSQQAQAESAVESDDGVRPGDPLLLHSDGRVARPPCCGRCVGSPSTPVASRR